MTIYEILAQRFTEGTEKYNTLYTAIQAGINNGTLSDRDVLKSPDSVINNLIRTIYSNKGDVVSGMILVNGVTYEGDGKRYAELGDGNTGGGSGGTDTTALIDLLNNSINTTTNNLSGQIEGLRTETNNTFKDTINLSDMTSYHILKGDISLSNEAIVTGYEALTWSGQATAKTIPITLDMVSQHGTTTNETYGGLILTRAVNVAHSPFLMDSIRRFRTYLTTTATNQGIPNDGIFTNITPTSLVIPNLPNLNNTGETQVMYALGTTHRKSATDGSPELSVNGDFANGTTGWINNGLLTMTVTNGRMVCTDNSTTSGWFYQDIPTTIGKLYTVKAELVAATGGDVIIGIGTTSDVWDSAQALSILNGFGATTFRATASTTRVAIHKATAVTTFTVDNISVKENTNPTNHNRWWECHYNPFTGLAILNFEGSGLLKHEIRHFLGKELDFTMIKSNTHAGGWRSQFRTSTTAPYTNFVYINTTAAMAIPSGNVDTVWEYTKDALYIDKYDEVNQNKYMYSMYGFTNSYKDENGKTIGAFEIGEYVPGQDNYITEVKLRGNPGLIMIKRLDDVGPWLMMDGVTRGKFNKAFSLNDTTVDQMVAIGGGDNKFVITGTNPIYRTYGGRYAYLVIYNTEAAPDSKFKYKKTTSTSNVNASDILAPVGSGMGQRGALISTVSKNSTLTGLSYTPGENYLFIDKTSNITTSKIAPKFLFNIDTTVNLGGFERDYEYDIVKQKWIKVVLSDVNENVKKDTLDFFGDGSCKALFRCNGDITEISGVYPPVNTSIGFVPGKFGQAAMFSAKESVMGLTATPLPITSRVVSVSNWIFGENPSYYIGFGRRTGNVAYNGNQWFRILGGSFGCGLSQVGDYAMYNFTLGKIGWNHYVTVLDGTYITIYVNGVKEFEYIMTPDVITNLNNFGGMYGILEESVGISGVDNKRLTIDQIRVFNRALTPAEVFKLFACYSYTYTDSNNTFLDHSVTTNPDNIVTGIKKYPKTQYVDKLVVNDITIKNNLDTGSPVLNFLGGSNPVAMLGQNQKRIADKLYYNTSGKTRYVIITVFNNSAINVVHWFCLNDLRVGEIRNSANSDDVGTFCIPVPNGFSYSILASTTAYIRSWFELEI